MNEFPTYRQGHAGPEGSTLVPEEQSDTEDDGKYPHDDASERAEEALSDILVDNFVFYIRAVGRMGIGLLIPDLGNGNACGV